MNLASPEVTEGLLYYGLITDEQADAANDKWTAQLAHLFDDRDWWNAVAEIAWHNEIHWIRRWASSSYWWKYRWVRARRGW